MRGWGGGGGDSATIWMVDELSHPPELLRTTTYGSKAQATRVYNFTFSTDAESGKSVNIEKRKEGQI